MIPDNYRTPLVKHIEDNLWSYPNMANQYQLKLTQLSPDVGYSNYFTLMGIQRNTPVKDSSFLIFNLSGIELDFWNFHELLTRTDPVDEWINVAKLCRDRHLTIDIYSDDGRLYPRDKCWVISTYDGHHLLAVKNTLSIRTSWRKPMYLHCYTVQTKMVNSDNERVYVEYYSNDGNTQQDINRMSEIYHQFLAKDGLTTILLNGYRWHRFPYSEDLTGDDIIELVNDPSVEKVSRYKVSELENYLSQLDQVRKLLIHEPKDDQFLFRYLGDCDFFLLNPLNQGVYFNRNEASYVRQLTHQDFGISAQRVNNLINTTALLSDDTVIEVISRKNDYSKPLAFEAQGIRYLYRLTDEKIIKAMVDVNSTVKEWQASNLESSESMLMLRRPYKEINHENSKTALGYNAGTLALGSNGKSITTELGMEIKVPTTCHRYLTLFEYDEFGLFLRKRSFENTTRVVPTSDAKYVEFFPGKTGNRIHSIYGTDPVLIETHQGFLVFTQNIKVGGELVGELIPAVLDKDYRFNEQTGELTWLINSNVKTGVVVLDDWTLYKTFTLNHLDHSLTFSITHQWEGGGILSEIAPANVVVIMNRRTLIENVDYIVKFPHAYILNHQYLQSPPNEFVLYCSGWSPKPKEVIEDTELGYVLGGVIGDNTRYNLREDRITRTVIDGRVFDNSVVPTSEQVGGSDLLHPLNGYPYAVKHWYTPLPYWRSFNPYDGYSEARDKDYRMSSYLTVFCEKPNASVIPTINDKYRVFSPFMNAVVNHLLLGLIEIDPLQGNETYSTAYVFDKVKPFKWWLEFDPVSLRFDYRYFTVFPYTQTDRPTLTPNQFVFLHRVNELFLDRRISMNGHFEVK